MPDHTTTSASISPILLEALARRAKSLSDGMHSRVNRNPDIADYRAAFEDELKRFNIVPEAPAVAMRAKLIPDSQAQPSPSLGRGLGQQTGGTAQSDADEFKRILQMIANVDGEVLEAVCGSKAASFIREMRTRMSFGGPLCVTGRQLFWGREIKDQLIEKGYV